MVARGRMIQSSCDFCSGRSVSIVDLICGNFYDYIF